MLGFIDELNKQGGFTHAFITTYEFSPGFFEEKILRSKALQTCPNITVFIDAGKYGELCQNPKGGTQINRRYSLIPVRLPGPSLRVFHPKLWLLLAKDKAKVLVGSMNATRPGLTANLEMVSCFTYETQNASSYVAVLGEAYGFIDALSRRYCNHVSTLRESMGQLQLICSEFPYGRPAKGDVSLIHNLDVPLIDQIGSLHNPDKVSLTIVSPYFDAEVGSLLDNLVGRFSITHVRLILQQHTNTIDKSLLTKWRKRSSVGLTVQELLIPGRKLHAKVVLLNPYHSNSSIALVGSANFTNAAMAHSADIRGNIELCLRLHGAATKMIMDSLQTDEISLRDIDVDDILSTPQEDTHEGISETESISLLHAELDSEHECVRTMFELDETVPSSGLTYALLVRRPSSTHPDAICHVSKSGGAKGVVCFDIPPENATLLERAVIVTICASLGEQEFISNDVWLLNVREVTEVLEKTSRKMAALLSISGEGLCAFISRYLENGMVDKAIDFLDRLNLKMKEDSSGRLPRQTLRRPSSPLTGDDVSESVWAMKFDQEMRFANTVLHFISRHHDELQKRHIRRPNLNEIGSFMNVLERCLDLAITALRYGVINTSDAYGYAMHGFQLFSGNSLADGYYRELCRKYYDVKNQLRRALIDCKALERLVAYALLMQSIENRRAIGTPAAVTLENLYAWSTINSENHSHLRSFFEFVGYAASLEGRLETPLKSYENADFLNAQFCFEPEKPTWAR